MLPLDAFGLEGHYFVYVDGVSRSKQAMVGLTIAKSNGEMIGPMVEGDLSEQFAGAVVTDGLYLLSVTDPELFAETVGLPEPIPKGMYSLYYPGTNDYVARVIGPMWHTVIPGEYMPSLHGAYPQAATNDLVLQIFQGEVPIKAFESNSVITKLTSPFFVNIGAKAFKGCTSLATVDLPAAVSIGQAAFSTCPALTAAIFSEASIFERLAFIDCSALKTVILRNAKTVATSDFEIFMRTPIESGTGYIYVPRALVDSYKAADGWSTYASQFRALEDYTVDGTIAGELDESKI